MVIPLVGVVSTSFVPRRAGKSSYRTLVVILPPNNGSKTYEPLLSRENEEPKCEH